MENYNKELGSFSYRHIGPTSQETEAMLNELDFDSLDTLMQQVIPDELKSLSKDFKLSQPISEAASLRTMRSYAKQNNIKKSMIGMGYYEAKMPELIRRNVLESAGWYTSYTPYQAEISQGRLQALLMFQQLIVDLTGLPIANASLLDEATALAEAVTMARRNKPSMPSVILVDDSLFPQSRQVLETRLKANGVTLQQVDISKPLPKALALVIQNPHQDGSVKDIRPAIKEIQENGGLAIVATDILAMELLVPLASWGADIVVGSTQRLGMPMGYGGPHAAFMACKEKLIRTMPGRLIGISKDSEGRSALRMTLQTREQHIRRDKATSNICTAQALPAIISMFVALWHGPDGLRNMVLEIHKHTKKLAAGIKSLGITVINDSFFDTITIHVPNHAKEIEEGLANQGILIAGPSLIGDSSNGYLRISCDETTNHKHIETIIAEIATILGKNATTDNDIKDCIPTEFLRDGFGISNINLKHSKSESELMRTIRRMRDKDIALDRSMIPLGSCTMKLNSATEMTPISWPSLANMHPFAPKKDVKGYGNIIADLCEDLQKITGFDAVSLQPNAGSQGEFAGLLAIKQWQESRGEGHRNICLIPISAHGTNPASAAMAGYQIKPVKCSDNGDIDLEDLKQKITEYENNLAAFMVTYPSTHGVFEDNIIEVCKLIHAAGGQVYLDGANLNAMVGILKPADIGADVMHMNLHKTFCIPHGGGGPGVGPIGVKQHLAPYLPGHFMIAEDEKQPKIAAAPYGSSLILPIVWSYIRMMGEKGLTRASKIAILNANYIANRLDSHFPVRFKNKNGMVAHECILDLSAFKPLGITVVDVAKRLIDYGFHAPTMSWPLVDGLMIEPTESESKEEIDKFCDAMIQIRAEIKQIENGTWPKDNNPLVLSPHTAEDLLDDWQRPYSRETAAFPLPYIKHDKYWPPVSRVDNVAGDRNPVCCYSAELLADT